MKKAKILSYKRKYVLKTLALAQNISLLTHKVSHAGLWERRQDGEKSAAIDAIFEDMREHTLARQYDTLVVALEALASLEDHPDLVQVFPVENKKRW